MSPKLPKHETANDLSARAEAAAPAPTRGVPVSGPRPVLLLRSGLAVPLVAGRPAEAAKAAVDVCFVFDTTGSMSLKIDGLVRCTVDLVKEMDGLGLDWRVVSVPFGDLTVQGDRIVGDLPFVSELVAAEAQLRSMPRFDGGRNEGESAVEAMEQALKRDYRQDSVKVVVLITDEPALIARQADLGSVALRLREVEAICFVASPDLPYYQEWATQNGGAWFPISGSMDLSAIVTLLRALVKRVAEVAHAVHQLGKGSVPRYLALGSGPDPA